MKLLCEALGMALPATAPFWRRRKREALYDRAARAIISWLNTTSNRRDIASWKRLTTPSCGRRDGRLNQHGAAHRHHDRSRHSLHIKALKTSRAAFRACGQVSPSSNYHVQDVHRAGRHPHDSVNSSAWACSTRSAKP